MASKKASNTASKYLLATVTLILCRTQGKQRFPFNWCDKRLVQGIFYYSYFWRSMVKTLRKRRKFLFWFYLFFIGIWVVFRSISPACSSYFDCDVTMRSHMNPTSKQQIQVSWKNMQLRSRRLRRPLRKLWHRIEIFGKKIYGEEALLHRVFWLARPTGQLAHVSSTNTPRRSYIFIRKIAFS